MIEFSSKIKAIRVKYIYLFIFKKLLVFEAKQQDLRPLNFKLQVIFVKLKSYGYEVMYIICT